MKVLIKVQPLGLYNGRALHTKRGEVADLPDEYAAGLVAGGLAERVDDEKPKTTRPARGRGKRTKAAAEPNAETATTGDPDEQTATPDDAGAEQRPAAEPGVETRG